MKRIIFILAVLCLILTLFACSDKENNADLRIDITPNTVRYDKLGDTYVNISITNVNGNKNIAIKSYLPSFSYQDGDRWIYGDGWYESLQDRPTIIIKANETVDIWTELGLQGYTNVFPMMTEGGMTYGDIFDIFSSENIRQITSEAASKPRLYKLTIYGLNTNEFWSVEFTVTPPLSQVILRYALISVSALVVLGLLLFFLRRIVRRTKQLPSKM